jgi:hypothetical protein
MAMTTSERAAIGAELDQLQAEVATWLDDLRQRITAITRDLDSTESPVRVHEGAR